MCKIFEQFVRNALYKHLTENNLLALEQFGFCQGRSTTTQLLVTMNDWVLNNDNNIPTDAVYLDFSKAFDCVPHRRLMTKLHSYGIRGEVFNWIEDFLCNRSQYVSINENHSEMLNVTSGVPQGSVLGPTLFVYFINDLPSVAQNITKIFADDTKLYSKITSEDDYLSLQDDINSLVKWSEKWKMKFNSDKCKMLHLGRNNPKFDYTIREGDVNVPLKETICEKDLGINVDTLLDFNSHISEIVKKARGVSFMILRNFMYKDSEILVPLFKSLVRPHLEYSNSVWSPYKKKDVDKIEKVQRHYTKKITNVQGLSYQDRLKRIKLPSLEYRRIRGDLIEVFKITHNIYDHVTTTSLFKTAVQTNTRGDRNPFRLTKNSVNKKQTQMFFTNRIINIWNNLPSEVVLSKTINIFKNAIDKYLNKYMYLTNFSNELLFPNNVTKMFV